MVQIGRWSRSGSESEWEGLSAVSQYSAPLWRNQKSQYAAASISVWVRVSWISELNPSENREIALAGKARAQVGQAQCPIHLGILATNHVERQAPWGDCSSNSNSSALSLTPAAEGSCKRLETLVTQAARQLGVACLPRQFNDDLANDLECAELAQLSCKSSDQGADDPGFDLAPAPVAVAWSFPRTSLPGSVLDSFRGFDHTAMGHRLAGTRSDVRGKDQATATGAARDRKPGSSAP